MIRIPIPQFGDLVISTVLTDFTGTHSVDGVLEPGVMERIQQIVGMEVRVVVLTSDTFGKCREALEGSGAEVIIIPQEVEDHSQHKLDFLRRELDPAQTVVMGNGLNDYGMMSEEGGAALRFALCLREGLAVKTMMQADAVFTNSADALDALLHPKRITATLRGNPRFARQAA